MKKHFVRSSVLLAGLGLLASGAEAATAPLATHPPVNASAVRPNEAYQRFIVTYRPGSAPRASREAALQNVSAAVGRAKLGGVGTLSTGGAKVAAVSASYLRKLATGADLVRVSRKLSATEAKALMAQIGADPQVLRVQPDVMLHAIADYKAPASLGPAAFTPTDPYFATYQWHFRAGDGSNETIGNDVLSFPNRGGADVSKAWDLADGTGVTVAVIDTGITHHPDLDTSLGDAGYDFITDAEVSGRDTDGRVAGGWDTGDWTTLNECGTGEAPTDSSWHGTHVSGTIAELTNNSVGMAGSAFKAKVLPVRALGHCGGYTSDIADGIEWASGGHVDGVPDNTHPAQVINMSLGGEGTCDASDVTGTAIADAIARGTTVVVAAGNSGADAADFSPASCPGAITVASIGIGGHRAFYSNYGDTVALAAPGGGVYANDAASGAQVNAGFVWSAVNAGTTVPDENDYGYAGFAGTSQATPHVAGTVALIIGALQATGADALTPAAIRTVLTSTARAFPTAPDQAIGAGIVDAYAAVVQAAGDDTGGGGGDDGGDGSDAVALVNGVPVTGDGGSAGGSLLYKVDVPAGARSLVLRTFGGTGDVSLYVKKDDVPTIASYDSASAHAGNNESVVVARPTAGTYYLLVTGGQGLDNFKVSVEGTYVAPPQ